MSRAKGAATPPRRAVLAVVFATAALLASGPSRAEPPACAPEREPNDSPATALAVSGSFCVAGTLTDRDTDTVRFTVPADLAPRGWKFSLDTSFAATTRLIAMRAEAGADGSPTTANEAFRLSSDENASSATLDGVLLRGGSYVLLIQTSGGGPYQLRVEAGPPAEASEREPDDAPAQASPLAFGVRTAGDLLGSEDQFRFTVSEADARRSLSLGVAGPVGEWLSVELRKPGGDVVLSHSERMAGPIALSDLGLEPGDYTVRLYPGAVDPSPYWLTLTAGLPRNPGREDEPNGVATLAKPLTPGKPFGGRIGWTDDVDVWAIPPDPRFAGKRVELKLESPARAARRVCLNDASGEALTCRTAQSVKLPALSLGAGPYTVTVSGAPDPRQPYTLTLRLAGADEPDVESEPNDLARLGTPVEAGRTVRGRLESDDVDFFRFRVAGAPQLWRVTSRGGGVTSLAILDVRQSVVGSAAVSPDTVRAIAAAATAGATGPSTAVETSDALLLPGDYWVRIEGRDADYELEARAVGVPDPNAEREPNDNDRQAHRLAVGVPRTGSLEDDADHDVYRFSLAGPAHVALEVVPPPGAVIDTELEWGYPSSKRPAFRARERAAVYDAYLEPGDYTANLHASVAKPGRYRITLTQRSPFELPADREPNDSPQQTAPLPGNHAVDGDLGEIGEEDWFVLPVPERAGPLRALIEGDDVRPELVVGGQPVEGRFDWGTHRFEAELPAGAVAKLGVRGVGPYRLRVELPGGPPPAPPPPPLPVTMTVDLGAAPVAAFWIRGQRVRGTVEVVSTAREPLDLSLDVSSSHFAYRPTLATPTLRLAAGARERVPIEVAVQPDAWADRDIQLAVRATRAADGATASALARLVADPMAPPQNEETSFPIPVELLGGFDVASSALGGVVVGATDERDGERLALLHDGLMSTGGYRVQADTLPQTLTVRFGGDRPWPIRGVAIHPQFAGQLYPAEQLADFELLLSTDGTTFQPALRARLSSLPIEQPFVLPAPVEARAAQLRMLSNHADNLGWVGLAEWKMIATPGEPAGLSANLADPRRGGHVVRAEPVIGVQPSDATGLLSEGRDAAVGSFEPGARPEWVIGFQDDRAAQITRLEWQDPSGTAADAAKGRFAAVNVAVSVASPIGPWTELGTWDLRATTKGKSASWTLPAPTWARFVRFAAAQPLASAAKWLYPDVIRVMERPTSESYRSILGEWGMFRPEAVLEWSKRDEPAPAATAVASSGGRERAAAVPLELGRAVASEVKRGVTDDWWSVTIPAGQDTLALATTNEPIVDVTVSVEDEGGAVVPLRVVSSAASRLELEGRVEAGKSYRVHVEEPPWAVGITYDTSPSLLGFSQGIHQAVMAYADGVTPGREFVNVMNFSSPWLLPEWSDQPYLVQGAFAALSHESDSSALEETTIAALDGLGERRGARALVVVTDAESAGFYPLTAPMWRALARVRAHVFAAHIGSGREPILEKQIMQDLASAFGGHYASARTQAELDVIAARAAAWLRRPARYRLTATATKAPPPRPGSLLVSGPAPALAAAPSSAAPPSGAVELVFDASGSMLQRFEGKRRIDVANAVLTDLVTRNLRPGTPVALRVFGDDKPGSCETYLRAPLAPLDPKALARTIAAVRPQNLAKTSIAASIARVAEDLAGATGQRTVVLVTDGEETCGGDPRAEIHKLVERGFDVRVNIVGFAVGEAKLKDTFREWARAGKGEYFDAQSSKDLNAALAAAVSEPFRVLDASGKVVASGTVGGPAVALAAGIYRVEIGATSPRVQEGVVIEPGQATHLESGAAKR